MPCFSIISNPKIEKFLRICEVVERFHCKLFRYFLNNCWIIEGVQVKNLEAILLVIDFSKAFDSIHREKMEQILLTSGFPKETVTAVMMLYKNMKAMIHSPVGNIDFFNIVTGVLQGEILAAHLFMLWLLNVNSSNKRKWFHFKKGKKQTISHRNYDRYRLHIQSCTSHKYTSPSRIPTA